MSFFYCTDQYLRKLSQNKHFCQFSDKSDEKVAPKKTYRFKLEFYNTDRKIKNVIRHIFV